VDQSYMLHGHRVRVTTLDLNRAWPQIAPSLWSCWMHRRLQPGASSSCPEREPGRIQEPGPSTKVLWSDATRDAAVGGSGPADGPRPSGPHWASSLAADRIRCGCQGWRPRHRRTGSRSPTGAPTISTAR
jgi:hypothetical protein